MERRDPAAPQLSEAIYKGSTRPAMLAGVPFVPLVAMSVSHALLGLWLGVFVAPWFVGAAIFSWVLAVVMMRMVTAKDDQALQQWVLRITLLFRQRNRGFWGASVYCPVKYKKHE
jgi:type IV secretion system protein VirB3